MRVTWHQVAKHFRHFPAGLWVHSWGDENDQVESNLRGLRLSEGYSHDDVERHVVGTIVQRSQTTPTVGDQCLALQLDPTRQEAHVQFTYYPGERAVDQTSFLTGWVLGPTLIHSPTRDTTTGADFSPCGQYVHGGFSDPNSGLFVRARLPSSSMSLGGPFVISSKAAKRNSSPT